MNILPFARTLRTAALLGITINLAACDDAEDNHDNNPDVVDLADGTPQNDVRDDGQSETSVEPDSDDEVDTSPGGYTGMFADAPANVVVEVDYESGAAPYVEEVYLTQTVDSFDRLAFNAEELFRGTGAALTIPRALNEMEDIGELESTSFTVSELLDIAEEHRDESTTDGSGRTQSFYVISVDGYYNDGDGEVRGVIGVSIGRTGVIAMFKPVVDQLGNTNNARAKGEQATLIHELGHAVGLVNNPIPITTSHHDEPNGAHCTNTDCVMYWQNEGVEALSNFISGSLLGENPEQLLFDDACIADIRGVSPVSE